MADSTQQTPPPPDPKGSQMVAKTVVSYLMMRVGFAALALAILLLGGVKWIVDQGIHTQALFIKSISERVEADRKEAREDNKALIAKIDSVAEKAASDRNEIKTVIAERFAQLSTQIENIKDIDYFALPLDQNPRLIQEVRLNTILVDRSGDVTFLKSPTPFAQLTLAAIGLSDFRLPAATDSSQQVEFRQPEFICSIFADPISATDFSARALVFVECFDAKHGESTYLAPAAYVPGDDQAWNEFVARDLSNQILQWTSAQGPRTELLSPLSEIIANFEGDSDKSGTAFDSTEFMRHHLAGGSISGRQSSFIRGPLLAPLPGQKYFDPNFSKSQVTRASLESWVVSIFVTYRLGQLERLRKLEGVIEAIAATENNSKTYEGVKIGIDGATDSGLGVREVEALRYIVARVEGGAKQRDVSIESFISERLSGWVTETTPNEEAGQP